MNCALEAPILRLILPIQLLIKDSPSNTVCPNNRIITIQSMHLPGKGWIKYTGVKRVKHKTCTLLLERSEFISFVVMKLKSLLSARKSWEASKAPVKWYKLQVKVLGSQLLAFFNQSCYLYTSLHLLYVSPL